MICVYLLRYNTHCCGLRTPFVNGHSPTFSKEPDHRIVTYSKTFT